MFYGHFRCQALHSKDYFDSYVPVRNIDKTLLLPFQKLTDGRPQPEKNGNKDANTWKVVPMRNDLSLYKIVDDKKVNIAN